MVDNKQDIRSNTTDGIYWFLKEQQSKFDPLDIIELCDELLIRKQPIKHLKERYENKLKRLNSKQLKSIERNPENYSPATMKVVDAEVARRRIETAQWFYAANSQDIEGPFSRNQILALLSDGRIFDDYSVWKEGTKDWIKIKDLSWLKREFYFDQEIEEPKSETGFQGSNSTNSNSGFTSQGSNMPPPPPHIPMDKGSGNGIALGVLSFVSMPFWIGAIIYSFWLSDTEIGIMIPLMFSLFAMGAAIPVGIGLMMRRKWAWSMNLFITGGAVCLVILNSVFNNFNGVWIFFGILCAAGIYLLLDGREAYE